MTYAVMFHHFHDTAPGAGGHRHPPSEGSLSAHDFATMLDYLDERYELLDADVFAARLANGKLQGNETCLTFDDSLKCQYDIAGPELRRRGLQAFFFVYTSVFTDAPDKLEIYRDFRNTRFDNMEGFYEAFFGILAARFPDAWRRYENGFDASFLTEFAFYSENDRRYRWVRDRVLTTDQYGELMDGLLADKGYDVVAAVPRLWMTEADLRRLADEGHVVGLHSHSHPTTMDRLDRRRQAAEYSRNRDLLRDITGQEMWAMSHPCGRYNNDTLAVLAEMGVTIGFRSSLSVATIVSPLEVPREDHANFIEEME